MLRNHMTSVHSIYMMKSLLLSVVGALVFLVLVWSVRAGVVPGAFEVPYETNTAVTDLTPLVRVGVSEDEFLHVSLVAAPPLLAPRLKLGNHERTLRAFLFADGHDMSTHLYVEQPRAQLFFEVSGAFVPVNAPDALYWEDETLLRFFGLSKEGVPSVFKIDLRQGSLHGS